MASIAAGALVAEQVVSTGVEAGIAVSIAKPTQPLKASLSQIATSTDSSLALARSNHTMTVIGDKAYIFGGEQTGGNLCNTDVHAISLPSDTKPAADYACYPAFPVKEDATGDLLVPAPRKRHAACAKGKYVLIHGGSDESGAPIDEGGCIWLWDSDTLRWAKVHAVEQLGASLAPRSDHAVFVDEKQEFLVLHGGRFAAGPTKETWMYDFDAMAWTQLPSCPVVASSSAFVDDAIYNISGDSAMNGSIHILRLGANSTERAKPDALKWETVEFSSNPLIAPGPKTRVGGALIPITTGYGRHYLVYMFGQAKIAGKENADHPFCADIWALQVPSHGFTPANIKDVIRDSLPKVESGAYSWGEIDIVPTEQTEHEGKVHPGPRGYFAASPCLRGKGVVMWGGVNANGAQESDGWLLKIQ